MNDPLHCMSKAVDITFISRCVKMYHKLGDYLQRRTFLMVLGVLLQSCKKIFLYSLRSLTQWRYTSIRVIAWRPLLAEVGEDK